MLRVTRNDKKVQKIIFTILLIECIVFMDCAKSHNNKTRKAKSSIYSYIQSSSDSSDYKLPSASSDYVIISYEESSDASDYMSLGGEREKQEEVDHSKEEKKIVQRWILSQEINKEKNKPNIETKFGLKKKYEYLRFKFIALNGDIRQKLALTAISSKYSESVVCSPLASIFSLGMLTFGAEGSAHSELLNAIGIRSKSEVHYELHKLVKHTTHARGLKIYVATRMWLDKGMKIRHEFKAEADRIFKSCTGYLDMKNPTKAAATINKWVSQETKKHVPELIRESDVVPNTVLLLVNAIYLKGSWKHSFSIIGKRQFYGVKGKKSTYMMHVKEDFKYGTSTALDAEVLEIPYHHNEATFLIVLPKSKEGFNNLVYQLKQAPELLSQVSLHKRRVRVFLPKFKVTSKLNVKALYQLMGLSKIFDEKKSGLDKILKHSKNLYVDNAIQTATIDIDQFGSTGTAGDYRLVVPSLSKDTSSSSTITFNCDHPFLFYILLGKEQIFAGSFLNA